MEEGVNPKKLYVGNLNYDVTSEELNELFSAHGTVEEATVIPDNYNNRPNKGYGFVTMSTEEEAQAAIEALNETEHQGRTINVNVAKPPKPRQERNNYNNSY